MTRKIKYILTIASLILIGFIIYSFLFGKLFPYSPVILGFTKHECSNTVFYIQKGAEFNDFNKVDALIPSVEAFHELEFLKKPRIFIFKDKQSYYQRSMTKARFCAFYNGSIVMSPWAQKEAERGEISLEIYLEHECSHALLHQHSGILHAYQYPKWLLEGIAVYSANQMGTSLYPSKEETYTLIQNGNFMPPEYYRTKQANDISLDVDFRPAFMYSQFACIVDYLIEKYGRDTFVSYMKELIHDKEHDKVFKKIYGIDFNTCIQEFKTSVTT